MKIQFTSVHLHKTIPRLDAGKGQATQSTTHFTIETGHIIELDTASGVVRIAKGTAVANIPREGVERFGPTVAEAAAHVEMLQTIGRDKAAAIAAAEIESLATAAVPSVTAPPAIEQNVPLSPNAIAAAL